MSVLSCCLSTFAVLSRAAAKSTAARARRIGFGSVHPQWNQRAAVCERCPLRVIHAGKSYCGRPLLNQIQRENAIDGCGCPTREKARDPQEHCPVDLSLRAARHGVECNCKWCAALP